MGVNVVAPFQFITKIGTVNPARVFLTEIDFPNKGFSRPGKIRPQGGRPLLRVFCFARRQEKMLQTIGRNVTMVLNRKKGACCHGISG